MVGSGWWVVGEGWRWAVDSKYAKMCWCRNCYMIIHPAAGDCAGGGDDDDDDDDGIVYCHFQNATGPSLITVCLFAVHFSFVVVTT